jgi:uncharacterized membrane protein
MAKKKRSNKMKKVLTAEAKILKAEERLNRKENELGQLEKENMTEEKRIEVLERKQLKEMGNIERLEREVKKEVEEKPLAKITLRDVAKSLVGAFVGIVGHFAFMEGFNLSQELSVLRATMLFAAAYAICFAFVYFSGFRKVKETTVAMFVPVRATMIYVVAIFVIVIVLVLFGQINTETSLVNAYKSVAAISILAILGASAADMIGRQR